MATEVDAILELLQAPVLNPLKLEQAMTNVAHLTKSMSLRWEAGKVVKDPGGILVVYPPTLHLKQHEGELLEKEQVYEVDEVYEEVCKQVDKVEDQSSTRVGGRLFVEEEYVKVTVVDDDDVDVVIEENNNEVEICDGQSHNLSIVDGSGAAIVNHGYGVTEDEVPKLDIETEGEEFSRSPVGLHPTLSQEKCFLESSEDEECEVEQNQQELSRGLNLSTKAAPLTSSSSNQVVARQSVQQAEEDRSQPALPPPASLDLQLAQLSTGGVFVHAGGTPSQFSLSMADPSYARKLERALMELEQPENLETASQGQLVLVHDSSSWCRCLITQVDKNSVTLENVDTGDKLSVVRVALYQVPSKVASLPALAASCCLAGANAGGDWGEKALEDWTRMVEDRTLVLRKVLDSDKGLVELAFSEDGPTLTSCLQFLGHVEVAPQLQETVPSFPEQMVGEVGIASSDQEDPSPNFILLMFKDNPDLVKSLQQLDGLQAIAANCANPPGRIVNGSALLAPYQVSLFSRSTMSKKYRGCIYASFVRRAASFVQWSRLSPELSSLCFLWTMETQTL